MKDFFKGFGQTADVVIALVEHNEGGLEAFSGGEFRHNQTLERVDEAGAENELLGFPVFIDSQRGVGRGRADLNDTLRICDLRHGDGSARADFADDEFHTVLVDQLIRCVDCRIGRALAVGNDQFDLLAVDAALVVPFFDSDLDAFFC